MSGETSYFKLGLFVLTGIALIVIGVVILGGGELFTQYVTIDTATTESVEGLDVGGAVKYSGVPIGKVSKIEMATWEHQSDDPATQAAISRYVIVEMKIRRDLLKAANDTDLRDRLDSAISHGLRVRMASSGLTGPAYLEVIYLNPQNYPAASVPWEQAGMFVPSAPSQMSALVTNLEDIMGQVKRADLQETVADARTFIKNANTKLEDLKIKELQDKAILAIDELRGTNQRIKDILDSQHVKQTLADLPEISAKMRDALGRIDQLVHDPRVEEIIAKAREVLGQASETVVTIRRSFNTINSVLADRSGDLETIIVDLRRITDSGAAMLEDARANPSRLIFGEPPPHFAQGASK